MRIVIQRVSKASVTVDNNVIADISKGILCLVGICDTDTTDDVNWVVQKVLGVKLWPNEEDKPWRKSVSNLDLDVLLVSQFTLYGTLNKKHQPDYKNAMSPNPARELFDSLVESMKQKHKKVQCGEFGAKMDVALNNDGPVTLVIDSLDSVPRKVAASVDPAAGAAAAEVEKLTIDMDMETTAAETIENNNQETADK
jgi:D-aminoacyl-tRNA deacylase